MAKHTPSQIFPMTPQPEAIKGLLAFLPLLQNTSADFSRIGYWGDMNSRVSAATARNLFQYLHNNGFVLENFNWEAWGDEAMTYMDNRQKIKQADLITLYKIITAHLLADRVIEGHYDSLLENGFLADILGRIQEINQSVG